MKKRFDYYKKVALPHIRTTVYFLDLSKLQGDSVKGVAYTMPMGDYSGKLPESIEICVFIQNIKEAVKKIEYMPVIAHECTHVIQYICEAINAEIQEEKEHMAHIMSHLFEELLELKH